MTSAAQAPGLLVGPSSTGVGGSPGDRLLVHSSPASPRAEPSGSSSLAHLSCRRSTVSCGLASWELRVFECSAWPTPAACVMQHLQPTQHSAVVAMHMMGHHRSQASAQLTLLNTVLSTSELWEWVGIHLAFWILITMMVMGGARTSSGAGWLLLVTPAFDPPPGWMFPAGELRTRRAVLSQLLVLALTKAMTKTSTTSRWNCSIIASCHFRPAWCVCTTKEQQTSSLTSSPPTHLVVSPI
mmetsp:Transcript_29904/g.69565  ORF Transcript_29904/g.69565 Transcript_29904/m.69565 type:complete len:241 (+) Transcript_29904:1358-2080(+)